MKREYPSLYRESRAEARRCGETKAFKESFQLNVSCARAIEQAIQSHTGEDEPKGRLFDGCAKAVLEEYGFHRVQFVLNNTLIGTGGVGFEPDSLRWARMLLIPPDKDNLKFRVQADRSLLAQFVQQTYAEYQAQWMFGPAHCTGVDIDYTGKVLALRPDRLNESSLSAQNQLWVGPTGFGLSPMHSVRAVFAACLSDGKDSRWERSDFMGPLDERYLPDWALEKLAELRGTDLRQADSLGSMKMG